VRSGRAHLLEQEDARHRLLHAQGRQVAQPLHQAARLRLGQPVLLGEHAVALLEDQVGHGEVGLQPRQVLDRQQHEAHERGEQSEVGDALGHRGGVQPRPEILVGRVLVRLGARLQADRALDERLLARRRLVLPDGEALAHVAALRSASAGE
jgi:hypothetical protein